MSIMKGTCGISVVLLTFRNICTEMTRSQADGVDFSTCRVSSALAADLRMSHFIRALSADFFFVPGQPRTGDTRRNELIVSTNLWTTKISVPAGVLPKVRGIPQLSHRALSAMSATNTITP